MKQIKTLEKLRSAVWDKKAVIIPKGNCWSKRHFSASFILHLQGDLILKLLHLGMFIYESKRKRK